MTERERITAIIPAMNEERNIAACIDAVQWADEVFVVDSFSSDRTPEIAKAKGVRFVQHEYVNSAAQKNWAIPQASHPWVLIVDADERVTPELRDEILTVLKSPNPLYDGYYIGRLNHFIGRKIHFSGWQNDACLRLFRRDKGRYQDRHVHADVIIEGGPQKVGRLKKKLLHYTFESFDQYMKKFDRYTSWAAEDRARNTPVVRWHHLTLRPLGRFLKQYILKLGFLDGKAGLVISSMAAYSVFMKYARLWETREREARGKAQIDD